MNYLSTPPADMTVDEMRDAIVALRRDLRSLQKERDHWKSFAPYSFQHDEGRHHG